MLKVSQSLRGFLPQAEASTRLGDSAGPPFSNRTPGQLSVKNGQVVDKYLWKWPNRTKSYTSHNNNHAVEQAITEIRRRFGPGAIMQLGDHRTALDVDAVSTGALSLDLALGIGGFPRGRIVEVYGPESAGKSCLALHAVASVQRAGGRAAFIDAEHALDTSLARAIGVNMDTLLVSQPDYGEEALEIASALVHTAGIGIVVVDSVAALVPKAELEGEMGEAFVGLQARLMSQALRKLAGAVNRSKTIVVFVNQIRERVGVIYGPSETTTGGRALKFYASLRLEVRRVETLKDGDRPIGQRIRVKVAKNKLAPPFREVQLDLLFNHGIDTTGSLLDAALATRVLTRSGSWILYHDRQIGQGREAAREALIGDPAMAGEIERHVRGRSE